MSLLLKINHAATKHWKAAAWMLEHLYPHLYGKLPNLDADTVDQPPPVDHSKSA